MKPSLNPTDPMALLGTVINPIGQLAQKDIIKPGSTGTEAVTGTVVDAVEGIANAANFGAKMVKGLEQKTQNTMDQGLGVKATATDQTIGINPTFPSNFGGGFFRNNANMFGGFQPAPTRMNGFFNPYGNF